MEAQTEETLIKWHKYDDKWDLLNRSKKAALKIINNIFDWFLTNERFDSSLEISYFESSLFPPILVRLKNSLDLAFKCDLLALENLLSVSS